MDRAADGLTIAELAQRAEVTPRTIRYYVAEGLLPPPKGRGQRRVYSFGHYYRLVAIKRLKEAFLPLTEIRRRLLALSDHEIERLATQSEGSAATESVEYVASLVCRAVQPRLDRPSYPLEGPVPYQLTQPTGMLGHATLDVSQSRGAYSTVDGPIQAHALPDEADDAWHRVTLAPGVEIHYQKSGDRRRDEAIAHIIRVAASILSSTSR